MSNLKKIPDHARLVFKGVLHDVYHWDQPMFDGSIALFEAIRRQEAVTVIATTHDKKIILNHEEQPSRPFFIGFPGGQTEEGQTLLENAKRELEEETGYISEDWNEWLKVDILKTHKIDWWNQFYIAKNCEPKGTMKLDPGEKIETRLLSFEEFLAVSQHEKFRNSEIKNLVKNMLGIVDESLRNEKIEEFKKLIF